MWLRRPATRAIASAKRSMENGLSATGALGSCASAPPMAASTDSASVSITAMVGVPLSASVAAMFSQFPENKPSELKTRDNAAVVLPTTVLPAQRPHGSV
jgi:hypothetical protein